MRRNFRRSVQISEDNFLSHRDQYDGFCSFCCDWTTIDVEPNARRYTCEVCQKPKVYGAEEALAFGYVEITECEED